jgi:SPASM domain peptide maturase of grasp-with-spasm system
MLKAMSTLNQYTDHFLCLHADCIPVKGASRSAIYDLTRNELVFFPTDYWEVLDYLRSDKLGTVLGELEDEEEKEQIKQFIGFLEEQEMIHFTTSPSSFPPIAEQWEIPSLIQDAIIDVDTVEHDFKNIFEQLDEVECQFVQIRCFSDLLSIDKVSSLLKHAYNTSIESVELILHYDITMPDACYVQLMEEHPILSSLILHSAPEDRTIRVDYGCDPDRSEYIEKAIGVSTQVIDSPSHCGIISQHNLCAPSVTVFFEHKLYNGCLNKKVAVDVKGEIKNCPSMPSSYGNIQDTRIIDAIHVAEFKEVWKINKDQIETCKDCELRYACSDCRAFLEQPENIYSKPLKCGYDPYTHTWEAWSTHPLKQESIAYYAGMTSIET